MLGLREGVGIGMGIWDCWYISALVAAIVAQA